MTDVGVVKVDLLPKRLRERAIKEEMVVIFYCVVTKHTVTIIRDTPTVGLIFSVDSILAHQPQNEGSFWDDTTVPNGGSPSSGGLVVSDSVPGRVDSEPLGFGAQQTQSSLFG